MDRVVLLWTKSMKEDLDGRDWLLLYELLLQQKAD
jgi:hypothetical protein